MTEAATDALTVVCRTAGEKVSTSSRFTLRLSFADGCADTSGRLHTRGAVSKDTCFGRSCASAVPSPFSKVGLGAREVPPQAATGCSRAHASDETGAYGGQ